MLGNLMTSNIFSLGWRLLWIPTANFSCRQCWTIFTLLCGSKLHTTSRGLYNSSKN